MLSQISMDNNVVDGFEEFEVELTKRPIINFIV
jgi:hypothetical protein